MIKMEMEGIFWGVCINRWNFPCFVLQPLFGKLLYSEEQSFVAQKVQFFSWCILPSSINLQLLLDSDFSHMYWDKVNHAIEQNQHQLYQKLSIFIDFFNLKKNSQSFCLETVIFFQANLKFLNVVIVKHRERQLCVCVSIYECSLLCDLLLVKNKCNFACLFNFSGSDIVHTSQGRRC